MSKTLAIHILKGEKWVLFHTNIDPTKQGENLYHVEKWIYHIVFLLIFCGENLAILKMVIYFLFTPAAFFPPRFSRHIHGHSSRTGWKDYVDLCKNIIIIMSTDKGLFYKELYKSRTRVWSPQEGLTEEILLW